MSGLACMSATKRRRVCAASAETGTAAPASGSAPKPAGARNACAEDCAMPRKQDKLYASSAAKTAPRAHDTPMAPPVGQSRALHAGKRCLRRLARCASGCRRYGTLLQKWRGREGRFPERCHVAHACTRSPGAESCFARAARTRQDVQLRVVAHQALRVSSVEMPAAAAVAITPDIAPAVAVEDESRTARGHSSIKQVATSAPACNEHQLLVFVHIRGANRTYAPLSWQRDTRSRLPQPTRSVRASQQRHSPVSGLKSVHKKNSSTAAHTQAHTC